MIEVEVVELEDSVDVLSSEVEDVGVDESSSSESLDVVLDRAEEDVAVTGAASVRTDTDELLLLVEDVFLDDVELSRPSRLFAALVRSSRMFWRRT